MALTRPRYSQIYDTDYKQSVRVATTGDVGNLLATGNMTNTVDGKLLAVADRILVKDQLDAKQNGIYKVLTLGTGVNGTWIRTTDADANGNGKVTSGMTTTVAEGDVNISKTYKLSTPDPITVGVTELTFINPFASSAVGSDKQIPFNDSGTNNATANLTFDKTNNTLTVSNAIVITQLIGNANVTVSGSLIPSANVTYDLGSSTQRWRTGYFSAGTIDLGGSTISVDPVSGFTFTAAGSTTPTSLSPSGALSGNSLTLTNTTVASSTTTGVLQVSGGAGISGNLWAGNVIATAFTYANGQSILDNVTSAWQANAGAQAGDIANLWANAGAQSGSIVTANTAMKGYVDAVTTAWQSNAGAQAGTLATIQSSYAQLAGATFTGSVSISDATNSTVFNNGALTVSGGLGVAKDVYINGNLYVANIFNTSSTILTIEDPLLYLEAYGDELTYTPYNYDVGFYSHFWGGTANVYQHTGLVRNDSDGIWRLFSNVAEPSAGQVTFDSNTVYDDLMLGNVISTGNIVLSGNVQHRIRGDFSTDYTTVPLQNKVFFQSLGVTDSTYVGVLPGGMDNGSTGGIKLYGNADPNNSTVLHIDSVSGSESRIISTAYGSATKVPLRIATIGSDGWSKNLILDLGGNLSLCEDSFGATAYSNLYIGHTTASSSTTSGALQVKGGVGIAGNLYAGNVQGTNLTGTIRTAAQTSITSVGTLTALTVSGAITVNSGNNATAIVNGGTAGVGNIGASGQGFNTVFAKATSAQYADLAEVYTSDKHYVPGTVVVFGGSKEVTISETSHDTRVAGVVSTNPAYLMNDTVDGVAVALQGRVPCRVLGPISKGDRIVSSHIAGVGCALSNERYQPGCIIGKALEDVTSNDLATIEVVVGRN